MVFDVVLGHFRGDATDEQLALFGFGLLHVHLFVVYVVLLDGQDAVERVRTGEHDKCEASRVAGFRVRFQIDALDRAVLREVLLHVFLLGFLAQAANE